MITAWVIEKDSVEKPKIVYWTSGVYTMSGWSYDYEKAIKFCRYKDAVNSCPIGEIYRITQHSWEEEVNPEIPLTPKFRCISKDVKDKNITDYDGILIAKPQPLSIIRSEGSFTGRAIYLSGNYKWSIIRDEIGELCLIKEQIINRGDNDE